MSDAFEKQFNKLMKMIDGLQENIDTLNDQIDDISRDADPDTIMKMVKKKLNGDFEKYLPNLVT